MVIDLHSLNQFTLVESFKMESLNSIRQALRLAHQKPEVYKLHAWKLSNDPYVRGFFLKGCPPASLKLGETPLREYIKRTGAAGWTAGGSQ